MRISVLYSTLVMLVLSINISQAQNQKYIEVYACPTISTATYDGDEYDEKALALRYSVGMSGNYLFSGKLLVGTGFEYSAMGYNLKMVSEINEQGVRTGNIIAKVRYFRKYLEIPVHLGYRIGFNKGGLLVKTSLYNQLLVKLSADASGIPESANNWLVDYKGLKELDRDMYNLALQFSVEYQQDISEKLLLSFGTYFKSSLTEIGYSYKDYALGFRIGLAYTL